LSREDSEGGINLGSDDLKEILADAPIFKKVATVIVEGDGQSGEEEWLRFNLIT